jgi:hypothetical protein
LEKTRLPSTRTSKLWNSPGSSYLCGELLLDFFRQPGGHVSVCSRSAVPDYDFDALPCIGIVLSIAAFGNQNRRRQQPEGKNQQYESP